MRVLIGFEESATIREAMTQRGHDAWSCDLLPSRLPGKHFQGDIFIALKLQWDLVILHPDCTCLALSGNGVYGKGKSKHHLRLHSLAFIERLWRARFRFERFAIENPVGAISTQSTLGPPDQYIQPYEYGHGETKKTGLWLHGLPKLKPTNLVAGRKSAILNASRSKYIDRKKVRAKTYQGWADAMADQWTR